MKKLSPPFGWIGGKSKLRAELAGMIPEQDIPLNKRSLQRYVEVFGGAAWLLLYKPRWFSHEVYNDINEGLVNMFSVIRFHGGELEKELEGLIHSQKLFDYYKDTLHLTDIQKAAATLVRYGWSFSSNGRHYAFEARSTAKEWTSKVKPLRERLQSVAISNEGFEKCVQRWNKENTFLYLDPPYWGAEDVYEDIPPFGEAEHIRLQELLKESKTKWMLSYGDTEIIRDLYQGYYIKETKVRYSALARGGNSIEAPELIITNYNPEDCTGSPRLF